MTLATVMVVEDDDPLRSALVAMLGSHDFATVECGHAEVALVQFDMTSVDLVLLDLALPGADGLHVLSRIRKISDVPVVVLTVRDDKTSKLAALNGGADDYVTKPFDSDELVARIRAALRRRPETQPAHISVDVHGLEIDLMRRVVTRDGAPVKLTATEWNLLELLVVSGGRLLTYETLSRELRGGTNELDAKSLRVFVARLRGKLGDDAADPSLILTHFGLGVRWIADEEDYER